MAFLGIDELNIFKLGSPVLRGRTSAAKTNAGISVAYGVGGANAPIWLDKKNRLIGIEVPLAIVNPNSFAVAIEDIRLKIKTNSYILESFTPAEIIIPPKKKNDLGYRFYPYLISSLYENQVSLYFPVEIFRRKWRIIKTKIKDTSKLPDELFDINQKEFDINPYGGIITITTNKGTLKYSLD